MILDKEKVFVIYNTDDASGDSQTVAEYYATARGLTSAYVQGFALGTTDVILYAAAAAYRAGVLTDIKTAIDAAGDIEGIVISINCPIEVDLDNAVGNYLDKASLCKTIGSIDRVVGAPNVLPLIDVELTYRDIDYIDGQNEGPTYDAVDVMRRHYGPSTGGTLGAPEHLKDGTPVPDWRNAGSLRGEKTLPCGRLGHHSGFTDSAVLAIRCIDDAIWFEQNGDPSISPILIGMAERATNLLHCNGYDVYHLLNGKISPIHTYDGDYGNNASSKYAAHNYTYDLPVITIPDQATWLSGGGPVIDLWGWLGTGFENNGDVYKDSVNFLRGAWMFESTSTDVSSNSLLNGACCSIGPIMEPTVSGVPTINGLARMLLQGYSMMEAEMCSYPLASAQISWHPEVWGDPLYTPMGALAFSRHGGSVSGVETT